MTAPPRLGRVDLSLLRGADPRARRRAVTALGDGFRSVGALRVAGEPAAAESDEVGHLEAMGCELLAGLERYFGLAVAALGPDPRPLRDGLPPSWAGRPPGLLVICDLGAGFGWSTVDGDRVPWSGRFVAVAGRQLEVVTNRVVQVREIELEAIAEVRVIGSEGGALGPHPAFGAPVPR